MSRIKCPDCGGRNAAGDPLSLSWICACRGKRRKPERREPIACLFDDPEELLRKMESAYEL